MDTQYRVFDYSIFDYIIVDTAFTKLLFSREFVSVNGNLQLKEN